MTPAELKTIRQNLKLSAEAFAKLIGVKNGRTIRYWEDGQEPNGSSLILVEAIRDVPGFAEYLRSRPPQTAPNG